MVTCKHLCYWYGKKEESLKEAVRLVILTCQESELVSFYREVFKFCPECRKM
jgi:hypothetical protein